MQLLSEHLRLGLINIFAIVLFSVEWLRPIDNGKEPGTL